MPVTRFARLDRASRNHKPPRSQTACDCGVALSMGRPNGRLTGMACLRFSVTPWFAVFSEPPVSVNDRLPDRILHVAAKLATRSALDEIDRH